MLPGFPSSHAPHLLRRGRICLQERRNYAHQTGCMNFTQTKIDMHSVHFPSCSFFPHSHLMMPWSRSLTIFMRNMPAAIFPISGASPFTLSASSWASADAGERIYSRFYSEDVLIRYRILFYRRPVHHCDISQRLIPVSLLTIAVCNSNQPSIRIDISGDSPE